MFDQFFLNENSVLPILIDKNFKQKTYLRSIFFNEGKSNFSDQTWIKITEITFSTSSQKFKIFSFIFFEKRRLPQGIRRPKAADSPLLYFIKIISPFQRHVGLKRSVIGPFTSYFHCISKCIWSIFTFF